MELKMFSGLSAILIWSLSATILAKTAGINAFLLLSITYLLGFFAYSIFYGLKNIINDIKNTCNKYILFALLGIGIHDLMWIFAIQNAPPEQSTLIIYQWPLLIILFSYFFRKERLHLNVVLGLLLSTIGILTLLNPKGELEFHIGYVYALISAVSWAIYSAKIATDKKLGEVSNKLTSINFFGIWYY